MCFLALGAPKQIDASASIIRNIEAQTSSAVRYHLLVDQPREALRKQMHEAAAWRGVPKRKITLHSARRISSSTRALYRRLSSTATGPGPIYLYKPLLHLVLPRSIERVIVLDTDLFFFADVCRRPTHSPLPHRAPDPTHSAPDHTHSALPTLCTSPRCTLPIPRTVCGTGVGPLGAV